MKFFEAVPDELFSPLASPNRALYADALDVLCMAYRQKLRLPEDELYSMLRSRLEQQLADATFEGEDIDESELRDISGRARFLIRKLCAKGWFEKERGPDFREYITVPGYASRLLELFHELRDDRPARGFSYVCSAPIPRSGSRTRPALPMRRWRRSIRPSTIRRRSSACSGWSITT